MNEVDKSKSKLDADGYDTTLLSGPCCICGELLDYYQTKMENPETKQVACTRHPETRFSPGFRIYSDG